MQRHLLLVLFVFLSLVGTTPAQTSTKAPKNVIVFISDGAGPASFTMARDYAREHLGQTQLNVDAILVGSSRTRSTTNRVTDSAAGATAYAAAKKSYNGAISVDDARKPIATLLEAAELKGWSTGIVSTSRVTHATPAAFSSHVPDRNMEQEIAEQQIEQGIEVIFGGGRSFYMPEAEGGKRKDGRNLFTEAKKNGVTILEDVAAFRKNVKTPAIGLFNGDHLNYELDRDSLKEPSLAEMTRKAIELLRTDKDGFFLMVEGSRIDHAGHDNDAAGNVHETLMFDRAVAEALAFAAKDGNTLVISTSDHETGGLVVGRARYNWNPAVLAGVKASQGRIAAAMAEEPARQVEILREMTGVSDLSPTEIATLEAAAGKAGRIGSAISAIVSSRATIGWAGGDHSAVDVNLYAFGPGRDQLVGNHENDEIGRIIARLMKVDLDGVTRSLVQTAATK